jgi:hypothetical protein
MVFHQWEFYPLVVTLSYQLFGIFIEAQNLDMYPGMRYIWSGLNLFYHNISYLTRFVTARLSVLHWLQSLAGALTAIDTVGPLQF